MKADTFSGFIITENQFVEMCLTGSKQKPKVANDLHDKVEFIVTHAESQCQFWIHLLEQVCSSDCILFVRKLLKFCAALY